MQRYDKKCNGTLRCIENMLYWEQTVTHIVSAAIYTKKRDCILKQEQLDRINELARKAKAQGLTPDEQEEQATLRAEYIAAYRASLRSQLDAMVIRTPDGKEVPLKMRKNGKNPS